jgi:hypothetical protein
MGKLLFFERATFQKMQEVRVVRVGSSGDTKEMHQLPRRTRFLKGCIQSLVLVSVQCDWLYVNLVCWFLIGRRHDGQCCRARMAPKAEPDLCWVLKRAGQNLLQRASMCTYHIFIEFGKLWKGRLPIQLRMSAMMALMRLALMQASLRGAKLCANRLVKRRAQYDGCMSAPMPFVYVSVNGGPQCRLLIVASIR